MGLITKIFGTYSDRELKRIYPIADAVMALEEKYKAFSDEELKAMTPKLKERLANGEDLNDILPDAFAVCREAAARVLNMRHFRVQVIGGIVLHQGRIAEMKTGEGKTLVATLPAYLNALAGKGVHIVTVNDYLAKRDSEWMGKLYRFLGLSVGLIIHDCDNEQRRAAYDADITYGTNNELGFDYLRDNMVIYKERRVCRDHAFAIVDEVDSILIDEARTPLIISGKGEKSNDLYQKADQLVSKMSFIKLKEVDSKEDSDEEYDCDYIVDEKAKTATLTAKGVKKAEAFFNLENLTDAENNTIAHHINQAIKAYGIMQRDVEYVVKDGQVIIVDEFTGRLMFGRRYNEGLHQAIEAKEKVKIEDENKTLATITFQNFFRLYGKLSGMTGTALTEETEFREIYSLDVIEIPTNKPTVRMDMPDIIFKNEAGKFRAVVKEVAERHEKGQPVLVGTISIEKSELLSKMLKRQGVKHEVLNAKYHEKEAEIISQAGKKGAVTIATNMAGRGTDIMLGGNAEYMAKADMRKAELDEELINEATGFADTDNQELLAARAMYKELYEKHKAEIAPEADEVRAAGGLYIIGTERHESRRIDNQLRGRSGRQGDPGESRFYLSTEDDLMRLFGGERMGMIMNTLSVDDDTPIENKIISNTIESAQKKIESRNFGIRKNVLEYDNVMNKQREMIYGQRNTVLDGGSIKDKIFKMITDTIDNQIALYLSSEITDEWDLFSLREYFKGWLTDKNDFKYSTEELNKITSEDIRRELLERAEKRYNEREERFGSEIMREIERIVLLRAVDTHWMDHIDAMDELKNGIYLRSYGQKDPVIEYKNESFDMFNEMTEMIKEETARLIMTVEIRNETDMQRKQVANPMAENAGANTPVKKGKKIGRNDPCPCGSGKKYKKCCGQLSN